MAAACRKTAGKLRILHDERRPIVLLHPSRWIGLAPQALRSVVKRSLCGSDPNETRSRVEELRSRLSARAGSTATTGQRHALSQYAIHDKHRDCFFRGTTAVTDMALSGPALGWLPRREFNDGPERERSTAEAGYMTASVSPCQGSDMHRVTGDELMINLRSRRSPYVPVMRS